MRLPLRPIDEPSSRRAPGGARSPYESLRISGAVRSRIIAYGIGAFSLLEYWGKFPSTLDAPASGSNFLYMLLVGVALQAALLLIHKVVARYERTEGLEGVLSPLAMYLFELIVDAVTVALFAIATFRGLAEVAKGV